MFFSTKLFFFLGFSALYKEQSIIAWSQPMDIHFLSSWLFFYQFLMAVLLSPLIYILQGQEIQTDKICFFLFKDCFCIFSLRILGWTIAYLSFEISYNNSIFSTIHVVLLFCYHDNHFHFLSVLLIFLFLNFYFYFSFFINIFYLYFYFLLCRNV